MHIAQMGIDQLFLGCLRQSRSLLNKPAVARMVRDGPTLNTEIRAFCWKSSMSFHPNLSFKPPIHRPLEEQTPNQTDPAGNVPQSRSLRSLSQLGSL